jgi:hypothetical protein
MNIDRIPIGDDPPSSVSVIIEVPVGGEPVKYEFDKGSGALFVDRISTRRCAVGAGRPLGRRRGSQARAQGSYRTRQGEG